MFQTLTTILLTSLLLPGSLNFFSAGLPDYAFPDPVIARQNAPQRINNDSVGLNTTAKSILVTDVSSGAGLYSKDPARLRPIASITKLMTALVWLESQPDWDQVVSIEQTDLRPGGIQNLIVGEEVTARDLFFLTLVPSSNEAAVALARITEPENFVTQMNQKAASLGMTRTFFQEPTGLDAGNVSTTLDLTLLADAAFAHPEIQQAAGMGVYTFQPVGRAARQAIATDELIYSFLHRDGYKIFGAKTGFLQEAGYCLLMRVQAPSGQSLTIALLGAATKSDRWQEAKGLVDWALNNYQW